jgi:hypothetical protein
MRIIIPKNRLSTGTALFYIVVPPIAAAAGWIRKERPCDCLVAFSVCRRGDRARLPAESGWLPGRTSEVVRNNARQLLSVLDVYLALLLSLAGSLYRFLTPHPDAGAFPILALVALALSTYSQGLFSLDGGPGATRYRLLPLRGWQFLLAKDAALLAILLVLVLPLSPLPGLTFGLTALAMGHFPSVLLRLHQRRWRFTGGRAWLGAVQVLTGFTLGFAESQAGVVYFLAAAAACVGSSIWCGRLWDNTIDPQRSCRQF